MFISFIAKQQAQRPNRRKPTRAARALTALIGGLILLVVTFILSLLYGAVHVHFSTVWQSFTNDQMLTANQQIIRNIRIPRAIGAALVGALLAASGAVMQGMTRNPLASPSLMGVSSGASLVMVCALVFAPQASVLSLMLCSFVGAGIGALLVFGIALFSRGGVSPIKLVLAGMAVTAFLNACTSTIAIRFNVARDLSFWYAGGVSGVQWLHVQLLIPVTVFGIILVLTISRSINALSLGEEAAKGLGERTLLVKTIAILAVLLMTGAAVSAAGAVGFIGLIVPHITRFLIGGDYRWLLPCSAVFGAVLLVGADLGARMINPPFETPVGVVTALIGVPFFLYLSRHAAGGMRR